jgi:hypothetical protein
MHQLAQAGCKWRESFVYKGIKLERDTDQFDEIIEDR